MTTDLSTFQHIIWDWNGTILDDIDLCIEITNGLLETHDLPVLDRESYQSVFNFPVRDYYEEIGFDFNIEPFESLGGKWLAGYEERKNECRLRPGAEKLLARIQEKGIQQSIISAYQQELLEDILDTFDLRRFMTNIIGRTDPWADGKLHLGLEWMEKTNHEPHQLLFIGDTVHDFEMAKAMGIDCLLLADGHQNREKLAACGVPVIDSLEEITCEN